MEPHKSPSGSPTADHNCPDPNSSELHPPPVIQFSDFHQLNCIGSDQTSAVYKVRHQPSGEFYAVRAISVDHNASVIRQINREIQILRSLDHPNVVKCLEVIEFRFGEIHLLLEYLDYRALGEFSIPEEKKLAHFARQILSGLAYLHGRKIVHQDIKPSNFLLNCDDEVKIAGLGVSFLTQSLEPDNRWIGTMAYMSPERLAEQQYDGYAGDVWSLGISLLELYLGKFPYPCGNECDLKSFVAEDCCRFYCLLFGEGCVKKMEGVGFIEHPFIRRVELQEDDENTVIFELRKNEDNVKKEQKLSRGLSRLSKKPEWMRDHICELDSDSKDKKSWLELLQEMSR